jgi:3-phytase
LLASSQGNFSYAVFRREGKQAYLGSFTIQDGVVDGAEETDGIEICSFAFGEQYPRGFLIVQDGWNYNENTKRPQNFKVVDWRKIENALGLE